MEKIIEFIQSHANYAHWLIFGSILLAGCGIPISIDIMICTAATLAAVVIPAMTVKLILAIFFGCVFASWIAYWIGRIVGIRIVKWPFFSKILSEKRLEKMKRFHKQRGPYALIIGRFIPFGVRNCIYMSSGISRTPFLKFAAWDAVACTLWTLFFFPLYYMLGKNVDLIYNDLKAFNFLLLIAFCVTVIGVVWYKKRKKKKHV